MAQIAAIDSDPRYGKIGAPYRLHGKCTCRNNPSWPRCTLCQDRFRCDGCQFCAPDYMLDLNNETAKVGLTP